MDVFSAASEAVRQRKISPTQSPRRAMARTTPQNRHGIWSDIISCSGPEYFGNSSGAPNTNIQTVQRPKGRFDMGCLPGLPGFRSRITGDQFRRYSLPVLGGDTGHCPLCGVMFFLCDQLSSIRPRTCNKYRNRARRSLVTLRYAGTDRVSVYRASIIDITVGS